MKDIKVSLKKKKEPQYGSERLENLSEDEKKSWSSIEKNVRRWKETCYYNYKKLFPLPKIGFSLESEKSGLFGLI